MRTALLTILLAVLAGGCKVHRPAAQVSPIIPARASFQQANTNASAALVATKSWWETFKDSRLNDLVTESLRYNLGVQQLARRIEQAEALHRQAGARLFPSLSGSGSYEAVWNDLDDAGATVREDSASVGALLNWELDVWGRLRSARDAQGREVEATYDDWLGGRLLLSAAVVETYFEILEQREQLRLLKEQVAINETLLGLTRLRFGQGLSSVVDVLQQREQLDSTRALAPEIEAREGQLKYTLDVLLGRAPGNGPAAFSSLPDLPPTFGAAGVPSDLLVNRPDLLAAQNRIGALDYRVGEAIAARLPRFEIGGSLSAVGDPGLSSLVGSAFGSIVGPLFDAGERKAVVDERRAQLDAALAEFSNSYLEAVRDVETALLRERKQAERVALQQNQLDTAKRLLTETRNRYRQGLTDYLPVLAAVTTEQNLERELITSRRELLSARVALHRALGGPMNRPATLASRKLPDE